MDKWKEATFIGAIVLTVWQFSIVKLDAADASKKADKYDDTFKNIEQISKDLQDPNLWLYNYLINHDIDTAAAKTWSVMQKGAIKNSKGKPINGIPFLQNAARPEVGVMAIYINDSLKVSDTLWNFRNDSE